MMEIHKYSIETGIITLPLWNKMPKCQVDYEMIKLCEKLNSKGFNAYYYCVPVFEAIQ